MTTRQHLVLIASLALATWLWRWPIAPGMLYFFAVVNGEIPWKTEQEG